MPFSLAASQYALSPQLQTPGTFNDFNLPTQQTFSTGATINYQYDGLLRKTDVWHKTSGGSTMGRYQYEYDAASNVVERTDNEELLTEVISEVRAQSPDRPIALVDFREYPLDHTLSAEELKDARTFLERALLTES